MSKKPRKNCDRCQCLEDTCGYCQLHYKIKRQGYSDKRMLGISYFIPLEPCPKPLTGNDWLTARQIFMKR